MVDLSGLSILELNDTKRFSLRGDHTLEALSDVLVEHWIPLMECHKCGKSEYCKFAQPHPSNPDKKLEIKCGVAETALRNFVASTFEQLGGLRLPEIQAYLDGAYHLALFVLEAEITIGNSIDAAHVKWLGPYAASFFGRMTLMRDRLNAVGAAFGRVPGFNSARGVLFVEGQSEKAFLEKLRESRSSWFLRLLVECYGGNGNRKPARIAMLLNKFKDLGYAVYAQGDCDGAAPDKFDALIAGGQIARGRTFLFKHDFETSIPTELLVAAARANGVEEELDADRIRDLQQAENRSVLTVLNDHFEVDLSGDKIGLAVTVAAILNLRGWAWWQDEEFMASELGSFIKFIQGIPS